jgi:hypothetical protein
VSGEALQAVHPLKAAQIHVSDEALKAVHPLIAAQIHVRYTGDESTLYTRERPSTTVYRRCIP